MSGETKSKKKYEIDMCNGAILPKLLAFTLPLMCSSVLQLLFNAADIIVVGNFAGDTALAAVGSNTALINLLTNFFLGLSIGANVLVARFYGAKAEEDVSDTVHTAMLLSVFSGIILTVIGCIGARQILIWMQTPEDVLPLATTYLRIYFIGMTSMMVYNFGSAILRAKGDTQRPLYFLLAAGVLNVVLNLFFVIVLHMTVNGVAIATVIANGVSSLILLWKLLHTDKGSLQSTFLINRSGVIVDGIPLMPTLAGAPAPVGGYDHRFSHGRFPPTTHCGKTARNHKAEADFAGMLPGCSRFAHNPQWFFYALAPVHYA